MFDVEAARKAGYSDAEIAEYLSASSRFDAKAARAAGYSDSELIAHLNRPTANAESKIPGQAPGVVAPAAQQPAAPQQSSLGRQIVGAGEAALTAVTGATGGVAGLVGGTIGGVAGAVLRGEFGKPESNQRIDQGTQEAAAALTYAPQTPEGAQAAQALGEVGEAFVPFAGMTGGASIASRAAQPAVRMAGDAGRAVAASVPRSGEALQAALATSSERVRSLVSPVQTAARGSVGAAATDAATQRRATADSLPVPIRLTEGQATRDQAQLRFEQETAKDAIGGPLRERYADQNTQVAQNFEALIDQTGAAEGGNVMASGRAANNALRAGAARAKNEYRVKYRLAEEAGELSEPVNLQPLADYLNQNRAGRSSAPILGTIADELGVKEVGSGSLANGTLVAGDATLSQVEAIRKAVNRFVKSADPNDVRIGAEIKQVIDSITDGHGGSLYQEARAARRRFAELYENNAIVSDVLKTKRGTTDRQVAMENVVRRTVLQGSNEDVQALRRTLSSEFGGAEGKQAWSELQGATLRHMLEEATSGVGTDIRSNPIFSAAKLNKMVRDLERGEKLDLIFGKRGAQQIRDLNELAKVIYTTPPGTVNTSNTAGVFMAALAEAGVTGSLTGLPVPIASGIKVLSGQLKDRKVRARINEALGGGSQPERTVTP